MTIDLVIPALLFAALIQSSVGAIVRTSNDKMMAMALLAGTGALLGLALIMLSPPVGANSIGYIAASGLAQFCFYHLSSRMYALGHLNMTYPIMRATALISVFVGAALFSHETLDMVDVIGLAVLLIGIFTIIFNFSGSEKIPDKPALILAIIAGLMTGAYMMIDGLGVRTAHSSTAYIGWLFLAGGLPFFISTLLARGHNAVASIKATWQRGILMGMISICSYGIVVYALKDHGFKSISALREMGILFSALVGWFALAEPFGLRRSTGAAFLVMGILMINGLFNIWPVSALVQH